MAEPIRILHVIGIMNRGGAETMIMNLYRHVDRTKVQFDFVQHTQDDAAFNDEIYALGGRIYHCPRYRGKNHLTYIKWWNQFFREHPGEYPIVHGHIGSTAAIYLSIARKHGAYAIAHSHSAGESSSLYRLFSFPTRFAANHFFACSKDAGISRYGKRVGENPSLCQVLNNAVDTQKFAWNPDMRQQMRMQYHLSEASLLIGHVGRFMEVKNHLFLLDIFEKIREKNPAAALMLVGDGELRPQIEKAIRDKGLENAVILTGVQKNVQDYLQAMDVFLMPSLYEGLPVSMVEAQAAGLPCCVSDTVPQESAITALVQFRPLEDAPEQWADWVLERARYPRTSRTDELTQKGYDIAQTAQWLTDYYLKVVETRG